MRDAAVTLRLAVAKLAGEPAHMTTARSEAVLAQLGYAAMLRPTARTRATQP